MSSEFTAVVLDNFFEISATFIRKSIQEGYSVKYLLPEGVEDYIQNKKLY